MGKDTKISWAHHTLNLWIGCEKVSDGCRHCYAETSTYTRTQRAKGRELWGGAGERHIVSDATVNQVHRWNREARDSGERQRVFCSSLSDILEDRRELDEHRARLWDIVERCPNLDFLLLTKRPLNWLKMAPPSWLRGDWPRNAWAGVTIESDRYLTRAHHLVEAARWAPVRFVSAEPLLGRLTMGHMAGQIDWVIIGGESGPKARSTVIDRLDRLAHDCIMSGIPVWMKQLGSDPHHRHPLGERHHTSDPKGGEPDEWPQWMHKRRELPRPRTERSRK